MPLLEIPNLHTYYCNIHALKGISLTVEQGEIVTLIGANGAGKSTTLKTISGLLKPHQGTVCLSGENLTAFKPHDIVRKGLCQVPEGRRIFTQLSVRDNLEVGTFIHTDKQGISAGLDQVFELFPRLKERESQAGGTLSGGEQQMLAIGRALMSRPKILLLDEPSMGLAPVLVDQIFDIIEQLHETGTTILLVEQNATRAPAVADRGYVLATGQVVMQDTAAKLQENDEVRKAYLGIH